MNQRKQRAKSMMETKGHCSQFESDEFRGRSQTDPSKHYTITKTDNGLVCEYWDYPVVFVHVLL